MGQEKKEKKIWVRKKCNWEDRNPTKNEVLLKGMQFLLH